MESPQLKERSLITLDSYSGRFGNQVIAYNNLRQIAHFMQEDWWSPSWEGERIFQSSSVDISSSKRLTHVKPSVETFLQDDDTVLETLKGKRVVIDPTYLGNLTFRFMRKNPRDFLKNDIVKIPRRVSIHFRGTDFYHWNPLSILPFEYYEESIKLCLRSVESPEFLLFTDDTSLQSFRKSIEFLERNRCKWSFGPSALTHDFMDDFQELSRSEIIISSPSTFAISAGMIGNCKTIHSKSWIDGRVSENDVFWINLRESQNSFYSVWREV